MKKLFEIMVVLLFLTSALFTGCNKMDNNPLNSTGGNFLTIYPADKSQNIGIDESIIIQFAVPVDSKTIESNFVLISQKDISDSICPISKSMGHSDMNKAMMDTSMMNHLKEIHCTKGTFNWNDDKTRCEFKPDSSLEPDMDYMLYINSDMMNYMKNMMSDNGMMNGSMGMMNCDCGNKGLDDPVIITHFKTKAN